MAARAGPLGLFLCSVTVTSVILRGRILFRSLGRSIIAPRRAICIAYLFDFLALRSFDRVVACLLISSQFADDRCRPYPWIGGEFEVAVGENGVNLLTGDRAPQVGDLWLLFVQFLDPVGVPSPRRFDVDRHLCAAVQRDKGCGQNHDLMAGTVRRPKIPACPFRHTVFARPRLDAPGAARFGGDRGRAMSGLAKGDIGVVVPTSASFAASGVTG